MSSVAHSLEEALRHHRSGDVEQAQRLYGEIVRIDPCHADALNLLGVASHQRDENQEAIHSLRRAIAINPSAPSYHCNLGVAYRALGRSEESVASFQKAIQLNPNYAGAYYNLGSVLEVLGHRWEAIDAYREAVRLDPASVNSYKDLGCLLALEQRYYEAVACYEQVVALRPDDVESRGLLGKTLELQGRLEEAVVIFSDARRLFPNDSEICFGLAHVYLSSNDFENARECYEQGLEIHPRIAPQWKNLGCVYAALKEQSKAEDCFRNAIQIDSSYAPAYVYLGNSLFDQQRYEDAVLSYQQALQFNWRTAETAIRLGLSQMALSHYDAAERNFRRSLEIDPRHERALVLIGNVYKKRNDSENTIKYYRAAIEQTPDKSFPYQVLGRYLQTQGELEEADVALKQAVALDPGDERLRYYLGNLYKEWGRYDDAVIEYQNALELNQEYAPAHYELGNTYSKQKLNEQARRCYERVLELNPDDCPALTCLGNLYSTMDLLNESAACFQKLFENVPDQKHWKLWIASLCPRVFPGNQELLTFRKQLNDVLHELADQGPLIEPSEISVFGAPPHYNLQFHGLDNRPLKEGYASLFRYLAPPERPRPGTGKPKIGIVVTRGHEGVFLRYMLGALKRLSTDHYDLIVLCTPSGRKRILKEESGHALNLQVVPERFDDMRQSIQESSFDVLYYWEVGTDVHNYFLPFFRLAPIQCTSAGVLETSGIREVDYYISSDFVEPENGDAHYTENLIRARTLLSHQPRIKLSGKPSTREQFGLRSDQHVYLCPQKLQKFHPDMDALFAEILRRDPQGVLVIPKDFVGFAAQKLSDRFEKVCPDVFPRIHFVPFQTLHGYLSLTEIADVLLDPIYYGGGLTAYDGFSLNKPVVTIPTTFARGRYCSAFYELMGIQDGIANSADEYVANAVRLGTDQEYRVDLTQRISQGSDILFDDDSVVTEYDRIFQALIQEARSL